MLDRLRAWWAAFMSEQEALERRRNGIEDWIDGLGDHPDD